MEIDDLIIIGKLGFSRKTEQRFRLKLNPDFLSYKDHLSDIFLIYKDHSVRYVTVEKLHQRDENLYIRLKEQDVEEELISQSEVHVAIDPETETQWTAEEGWFQPVGMQVIRETQVLGEVVDWFNNGAQDVYVIALADKKEILIPDVELYIEETDTEGRRLLVKNIDELMSL